MRARVVAVVALLLAGACTGDGDERSGERPAPDASATRRGEYRATIRRTEHNVPHIVAADVASLGFGHGYAFAEDHLCSLADVVLQANSRAARFHGEGYLAQDAVYAALDIADEARDDFDGLDPDLRSVITGYADGYNQYLEETGVDDVPGYCAGEPWVRPIDEYDLAAYYKVLGLRASIEPLVRFIAAAEPPAAGAPPTTAAPPTTVVPPTTAPSQDEAAEEAAWASLTPRAAELGSNGWAIGPERAADGTSMLAGNPHFPWQGALRFHEVHLTVPGVLDVYGGSLLGSPAVNIGFNDAVAWTHTVSAGSRFTAYTLDLPDGDPTSYVYGDELRSLEAVHVPIEVLGDDGTVSTVQETIWFSHYGPVLSFPGVGWTEQTVLTIRDANADNDELVPQFHAMNTAESMDDFIAAHRDIGGLPWVNTIAASADGRIWYADTSAAPNLSPEAIAAWEREVDNDPITSVALDNGIILLDGSDPLFEWVDEPGARDPGLVPFDDQPQLERGDHLFNANDSYWLANPAELLVLPSPVFGRAAQPTSPRTRMNAVQLSADGGDSGDDGRFSFDELRASVFSNRVFTAERLADAVVERCRAAAVGEACDVLDRWDRRVDLDSRGAVLWREFIGRFDAAALLDEGPLWDRPFDPDDPVGTPSGLAPTPAGEADPVVAALEAAVAGLAEAGFALDVPLGEVQVADRNGVTVPVHGGNPAEGVTNVVVPGDNRTTSEDDIPDGEPIPDTGLTTKGYPIANGTSFVFVLEYGADGAVRAESLLTYGETGDPGSPFFVDQTRRFSAKDWKRVAFTPAEVEAAAVETYEVTGRRF